MIDRGVFQERFTFLCKWFGKIIDSDIALHLHEILSKSLTSEEFIIACEKILVSEKFFPCPQDFIDCIKGSLLQRALIEWQTEPALRSIVGKKAWDSLPPDEGIISEIKFRRKQFLEAYAAFAETASPLELTPTPPLPRITGSRQDSVIIPSLPPTGESGEEARARIRQIFAKYGREI